MLTVGLLGSDIPVLVCALLATATTVGAVTVGVLIGRASKLDKTETVDTDPAWSGLDRLRALTSECPPDRHGRDTGRRSA